MRWSRLIWGLSVSCVMVAIGALIAGLWVGLQYAVVGNMLVHSADAFAGLMILTVIIFGGASAFLAMVYSDMKRDEGE